MLLSGSMTALSSLPSVQSMGTGSNQLSTSSIRPSIITPQQSSSVPRPPMDWNTRNDLKAFSESTSVDSPSSTRSNSLSPLVQHNVFTFDGRSTTSDLSRHRESISSSSESSISEPVSPVGRRLSATTATIEVSGETDSDDAPWNLVAYHIPWGPGYEGYETGTLPGPDGLCIFLRSPTPLKRQRTSQACDKCRERKAKCSGARPSCARCATRGLACAYGPSTSPDAQMTVTRSSRRPSRPVPTALPQFSMSTRNRMRRKSSMTDIETSPAGGILPDNSGVGYLGDSQPSISGQAFVGNWGDEPSRKHTAPPLYGNTLGHHSEVSISTPPPFIDISTENQRQHGFPDSPSLLYADSLSGLNGYRFPPPEDIKDISMPQPQPPLQHFPSSVYSLGAPMHNTESSLTVAIASACRGSEVMWHCPPDDSRQCAEMSFLENLSPSQAKPLLDPRCQARSMSNMLPYQSSGQYNATSGDSFSQSSFGFSVGPMTTHFTA